MSALFPSSARAYSLAGRRGRPSIWLRAGFIATTLGLAGCDSDDMDLIAGIGQVWAYSTPEKSAVTAEYRKLLDTSLPSCPGALAVGENCSYSRCRYSVADLPPPQSAGTIALSGGLEDLVLEPQEDQLYRVEREQPLFVGGEKLTFEIGGDGDIERASVTLDAPPFVTVTEPPMRAEPNPEDPEAPLEPLEPLVVRRNQDLQIKWNAVPDSEVRLSLTMRQEFDDDDVQDIVFSCRFKSWLGAGEFTKENLESLPVVADPEMASLWVGTESTGRAFTGKWEHWFGVSAYEARPITLE